MGAEHVVVTGGTGFVGGWIVKQLAEQHPEFRLTIIDIERRKTWTPPRDDIGFIQADVTQEDQVRIALERAQPSVVIHAAGVVPTGNDRYTPTQRVRNNCYNINVNGTRHVLEAAKAVGAKHFILTSSVTIVSDDVDHNYPNMDESVPTGQASLVYGYLKVSSSETETPQHREPADQEHRALQKSSSWKLIARRC
jgi:sterol-4alpha-carboxylate 3-dehydrogenase (decarboxylating)